jgi:hypothetical protein
VQPAPISSHNALQKLYLVMRQRPLGTIEMTEDLVTFESGNGAMIVVQHDDGYALVDLIGDEGKIASGDQVFSTKWDDLGSQSIKSDAGLHHTYFYGSWSKEDIPVLMAVQMGGAPDA